MYACEARRRGKLFEYFMPVWRNWTIFSCVACLHGVFVPIVACEVYLRGEFFALLLPRRFLCVIKFYLFVIYIFCFDVCQ